MCWACEIILHLKEAMQCTEVSKVGCGYVINQRSAHLDFL